MARKRQGKSVAAAPKFVKEGIFADDPVKVDGAIRYQAMRLLQAFGWSTYRIAQAFGISGPRVWKILDAGNKRLKEQL